MKVKCINNVGFEKYLTIGKVYEPQDISGIKTFYVITTDDNKESWFNKDRFEVIEEEQNI
jgi:hypothetical protein